MKLNTNYKLILELGYDVEIRSNKKGFSRMYLVEKGKIDKDFYIEFIDNRQNRDTIKSKISTSRDYTHLGNALREMAKYILKDE
ncbi:hypothetical protein [Serratia nevei]|uniref:hypothetical protein n=1 Tax=Serratia nevei TaxID=2703794 RepID=UPI003F821B43